MGTVKYSGPVASFHCPTNAEIRSLKVHFSPKQLGSGTPSPENVRPIEGWDACKAYKCGKNIGKVRGYSATSLSTNDSTRQLTNNYGTSLNTVDYNLPDTALVITQSQAPDTATKSSYKNGYFCVILDDLIFDEIYKISFKITKIVSNPLNAVLSNLKGMSPYGIQITPQIIDDNIVCFTVPFKAGARGDDYKAFELRTCGMSFTMSEFMVTTVDVEDRVFEPYHGSTINYEFGVLGKNKFDYSTANIINKKRRDDTGAIVSDATGSYCQTLIPVRPNVTYTLSGYPVNNSSKRIYYIDTEENFIERTTAFGGSNYTFTTPNNCYYIQIQNREVGENASWETIQLELGSTATAYEPYNPNKTVYGGWVDLVSGEITVIHEKIILNGDKAFNNPNEYDTSYKFVKDYLNLGLLEPKATQFPKSNWLKGQSSPNGIFIGSTKNVLLYLNKDLNISTKEALSAYLAEHPLEFTYELATPIIYHVAPTQLQTFLSHNNVWSNADYVEVEYDLHETQNILARKQFIVANQPHVVTPAAAPLQNFVTDMTAPLKECKVYFSPVQEGEGDPSPDNVRAISGLEQLILYRSGSFNLPKEYQEVEYIESNGGASISKVLSATEGDTIKLASKFQYLGNSTNNFWVAGNAGSFDDAQFEIGRYGSWYKGKGVTGEYNVIEGNFPNEIIECAIEKTTSINISSWVCRICHRIGAETELDTRRIYYFRIYKNNTMIYNFIPCYRRADNIPGFYDTINGNFYVNESTGYFLTGMETYPNNTQIINIDWTTEAGTIYGGYVDLVTGEVWKTYYEINITELGTYRTLGINKNNNTQVSWFLSNHLNAPEATGYVAYSRDGYCSCAPFYVNNYYWDSKCQVNNSTADLIIEGELTAEEVDNWIKAHAPIQIVYPLKTPQLITTLTPTQLKSLRGTNNIWSNTNGNIELSYWKH